MTKEEIIEEVTTYIEEAPRETGKIQVILLGNGGWITCNSWDVEEE